MANIAVKVSDVSKNFVLPHEKHKSIKRTFTSLFKNRNRGSEVQHALRDITFDVKEGEFFGIVGRNGSGKSTLLKMLAGIYQPSKGKIEINGKLVPFIELGVGFNPELTGRENVYLNGALLGFSKKVIDAQYDDIVQFAELERFMDQKLKNYSSGMQVRLAFSLATRAKADVLLVDEVLAVGDAAFQRKCFEYFKELKARKKTVIFVTHDMNAVREYCDRAMLIDNSELKHIGDPQDIAMQYAELFMEANDNISEEDKKKRSGKRWGNGDIEIKDVTITQDTKDIIIDVEAVATTNIDKLIYGLHVLAQDGEEVTAMNNRMLQVPDIEGITAGATVHMQWRMLNIFNDGKYTITLTLVDDVANTLDWFTKAGNFTILRADRSTTPVLPPVTVNNKVVRK